ncbi:NtaA/DmoA family FMN-dependent monooxygenase [Nocardia sp. alder85J]|uniref:NtaA/DmoA family FMN-dependent monooxygenase n=1 Tax=Nocardia sp. alder85J TaxID=2862949 RepID=UPI001CD77C31|nr:NtaA/DmoA family FMN-dependent monooxygenase [Nocardia sp. alder85J]MCX4098179.1 NtaA/DmoA family FMN-dependent monooxygenase [Nocardia sp. alder85J]
MTARPAMSLHFNISGVGHANYAWRHPDSRTERALDLDYYLHLARVAERGKFDSIFIADTPALRPDPNDVLANTPFEPITLLSAIAAATSRIGVIPTVSTSYADPYTIARQIASLDLLSGGRAGVNLVTSAGDAVARNHGRDRHLEHGERYSRAAEFIDVLGKLWGSWRPDALLIDRERGVLADPSRITPISHHGRFFQVAGPLSVPPSPQGRPVVVQAGASPEGIELAGAYADAVYARSMSLAETLGTVRKIKASAVSRGRTAESVHILPGIVPYVAKTSAQAADLVREIEGLTRIGPQALRLLGGMLGIDVTGYELGDRVPLEILPEPADFDGSVTGLVQIREIVSTGTTTFADLARRVSGLAPLGMSILVGTGSEVAEVLETWFRSGAADGFNLMLPIAPGGIEAFVDEVVPVLQERGVFKPDYAGTTLRSHLGIEVPETVVAQRAG